MSKKFDQKDEDKKCAASKEYTEGACFSIESLCRMVAAWNIKCETTKHGCSIAPGFGFSRLAWPPAAPRVQHNMELVAWQICSISQTSRSGVVG